MLVEQIGHPQTGDWRTFISPLEALAQTALALSLGVTVDAKTDRWPGYVAAVAGIVASSGLFVAWRRRLSVPGALIIAGFIFPSALVVVASLWSPLFAVRYTINFLPAWLVAVSLGLTTAPRRAAIPTMLVLLVGHGLSLIQLDTDPRFQRDDYRTAVATIEDEWLPGDVLVLDNGRIFPVYAWYASQAPTWRGAIIDDPPSPALGGVHVYQIGTIVPTTPVRHQSSPELVSLSSTELEQRLTDLSRRYDRIWLLRAYANGTESLDWLTRNAWKQREIWIDGSSYVQLYRFLTHGPVEQLPPNVRRVAGSFTNGVRLVSYALPDAEPIAGEPLHVRLYWAVEHPSKENFQVFVRLVNTRGQALAQHDNAPLGGALPPTTWQPAFFYPDTHVLTVPADTSTGIYRLEAGVHPVDSPQPIALTDGANVAELSRIRVRGVAAPADTTSLARFEQGIELVSARITPPTSAQPKITVTLTWRARDVQSADYRVFVHLYDAQGKLAAQHDGTPANGDAPTSIWQPGDVVVDSHEVEPPPSGTYLIRAGLYDASGRLRLNGSNDDAIDLGVVTVE